MKKPVLRLFSLLMGLCLSLNSVSAGGITATPFSPSVSLSQALFAPQAFASRAIFFDGFRQSFTAWPKLRARRIQAIGAMRRFGWLPAVAPEELGHGLGGWWVGFDVDWHSLNVWSDPGIHIRQMDTKKYMETDEFEQRYGQNPSLYHHHALTVAQAGKNANAIVFGLTCAVFLLGIAALIQTHYISSSLWSGIVLVVGFITDVWFLFVNLVFANPPDPKREFKTNNDLYRIAYHADAIGVDPGIERPDELKGWVLQAPDDARVRSDQRPGPASPQLAALTEILNLKEFVFGVHASKDVALEHWMAAWDDQLTKSRPYWRTIPDFPLPYNSNAPHVAYDPYLIPVRRAGPYLRFTLQELPESDALAVTREEASLGPHHSNLDRERKANLLVVDPDDPEFLILNNRWPKMPYDSLLMPKDRQVQQLTREVIRAEMRWARRGLASEFHRGRQFVDDLHVHLYPQSFLPVAESIDGFQAMHSHQHVDLGTMRYAVPHIAVASGDPQELENAIFKLSEYLEQEGVWFNQHMLFNPRNNQFVSYFVLWDNNAKGFGFNTSGFFKIGDENVRDEDAQAKLEKMWITPVRLQKIRTGFWQQWNASPAAPVVIPYSLAEAA